MKHEKARNTGERRTQVPSHEPMAGVDDAPIEAGAASGAQLPPSPKTGKPINTDDAKRRNHTSLNPNQGDVLKPFWPD